MFRFSLLLTGVLGWGWACASTPWPGEERIEQDESFDAAERSPGTSDGASAAGSKPAERRATASSPGQRLAQEYRPAAPAGATAAEALRRHYAKCRSGAPPTNLVLAGHAQVEGAGGKLLGPVHWVFEPEGRFLERLTLATSADDLEYGEGVESERGFDGEVGWRKDRRGGAYFVDDVEGEVFDLTARLVFGRFEDLLGDLQHAGAAELEGAPVNKLTGRTKSGEVFHLYLHRDTHVLLGLDHANPEAPDKPLASIWLTEIYFERGLCLPKRVRTVAPGDRRTFTFAEVKLGVAREKLGLPAELRDIGGREGL